MTDDTRQPDEKYPNRAPWREVVAEAWGTLEERLTALGLECERLYNMLLRLYEHRSLGDRHRSLGDRRQQRHDPDPECPICGGVYAYLEGRPLTEDQQREFDQP